MKKLVYMLFGSSLLTLSAVSVAEEKPKPLPVPTTIEEHDRHLDPEVRIVESKKKTTYEYRVNGQLYMVKVVPKAGAPYYLLDTDGDGVLDLESNDPRNTSVPQWVLFRW